MSWQNISELILQVSQLTLGLCLTLTSECCNPTYTLLSLYIQAELTEDLGVEDM